jgi:hypothetical protein
MPPDRKPSSAEGSAAAMRDRCAKVARDAIPASLGSSFDDFSRGHAEGERAAAYNIEQRILALPSRDEAAAGKGQGTPA